ncbi:unnamed protein product [Notodromas monacha]|uniref:Uncharacterized protein n=1 Tax=Notodromas monacha TaxID=399045 RepID=A0A7R9BLB7_9CRUS|nr:unnamed protein product [Notodromas monacha]CAG0916271.1 unnamed protein product [Notodromas monacha]
MKPSDRHLFAFGRKLSWCLLMLVLLILTLMSILPQNTEAAGKGPVKSVHKLYPYYWKSKIRYPYYDKYGRGKLLYGYGGPDLYEYTAFKPIDAVAPAFTYKKVLKRIASHGIVVVAPWRLSILTDFQDPTIRAIQGITTVKWSEKHLEYKVKKKFKSSDKRRIDALDHFSIDWSRKILGGQSAGAHVGYSMLRLSKCKLGFKGVALVNPVDGRDPFGFIPDFTVPSTWGKFVFPVALPLFVLKAGLDPVPGWNIPFFPGCAPPQFSNERYYLGSAGPKWYNVAMLYGHADVLDPFYEGANQVIRFCATKKETDKFAFRSFVAGQFVAFIKATLYPERYCYLRAYLEEPDLMNIPYVLAHSHVPGNKFWDPVCPGGFCEVIDKVKPKSPFYAALVT